MYRDHLLEDSPNPGRSAARQPTGGPRGSVLVVEDDALLALALEDALLDAGFSVCAVAASEEQAVSDALTHRPAFAVVDVRLLSGCGRKVASVLACQFGTTVVMATAEDPATLHQIGALAVLPKPYDPRMIPLALQAATRWADGLKPDHIPRRLTRLQP